MRTCNCTKLLSHHLLRQTPELPFHAGLEKSSAEPLTTFLIRWGCVCGRSSSFVLLLFWPQSDNVTREWRFRLQMSACEAFRDFGNRSASHTHTHTCTCVYIRSREAHSRTHAQLCALRKQPIDVNPGVRQLCIRSWLACIACSKRWTSRRSSGVLFPPFFCFGFLTPLTILATAFKTS